MRTSAVVGCGLVVVVAVGALVVQAVPECDAHLGGEQSVPPAELATLTVQRPVMIAPPAATPPAAQNAKLDRRSVGSIEVTSQGILNALNAPQRDTKLFGAGGSGAGINHAIAGLNGSAGAGDAMGIGGLGSRGAGSGGGGTGLGLGGLGTRAHGGKSSGAVVGRGRGGGAISYAGGESQSGEGYQNYGVNPFMDPSEDRLSTFAVDVDTASYTIARRKILEGGLPPKDAVRVEEWVNYFRYGYTAPTTEALSVAAPSPYSPGRHLIRVGVQGRKLALRERKPAHLTFLVDVSGSMQSEDKLPLAQRALRVLVDNLKDGDSVALVTYAGSTRVVLPPTGLEEKAKIHQAIAQLSAGGSTAMSSGIQLAYEQAAKTLSSASESRVIILSDGDANVGATSHEAILAKIAGHVKEGVTLSVVGFGMGNYQDSLMEQLANKGNGNYVYVDSLMEARRVFQEQLGGTLEVIAKDVKLQVEFDPSQVRRYRLVGYENRDVADRDFRNDRVDAGEIGSGHTVTALYEVELAPGAGDELAMVRIRAKSPKGEKASEAVFPFRSSQLASRFEEASRDFRFAVAVMGAAEILRQSPEAAEWSLEQVAAIARASTSASSAERREFVDLVEQAIRISTPLARK